MDQTLPDRQTLLRAVALTATGERLGLVVDVHDTANSSEPDWVWVRTGVVASDVALVPLTRARYGHGSLVVPTTAAVVERAPQHPAGTSLSPEQDRELREHYGLASRSADDHPVEVAVRVVPTATSSSAGESGSRPDSDRDGTVLRSSAPGQEPRVQPAPVPVPAPAPAPVPAPSPGFVPASGSAPDAPRGRPAGRTRRRDVVVDLLEAVLRRLDDVRRRVRP